MSLTEVQALCAELVKRPSLTPEDAGCQDLIHACLEGAGFRSITLHSRGTTNLLSLHGTGRPFLLFLGHTDVVPPGELSAWSHPPFAAEIDCGTLYGRGTADMKGSDAAMTLALRDFARACPGHRGTVGLLLTSNEEGDAAGGTPFAAEYLKEHALIPDYCLVGEPSSLEAIGDQVKIGRRGSLTAHIEVLGMQGHVAYPRDCDNAAHRAAALISALSETVWDSGSDSFPPSSFQVTNISCGTGAENVVPGSCRFMCNWRFNDTLSRDEIAQRVSGITASLGLRTNIRYVLNGLPFITRGGALLEALTDAIESRLGLRPRLSTSGGTSDGRFIAPLGTQVVEFGPVAKTIHKADENVRLEDLDRLLKVFGTLLARMYQD